MMVFRLKMSATIRPNIEFVHIIDIVKKDSFSFYY